MIKKLLVIMVLCLSFTTQISAVRFDEDGNIIDIESANEMGSVMVYADCIDGNTITLHCHDTKNVAEIRVYRGTSPYGRFYYVGSTNARGEFTMTNLTPYKTYYWKVVAEKWDRSEVAVRDLEQATYLHAPKNAKQSGKKLTWKSVKSAHGYTIHYQEGLRYRKIGSTKQTTYTVKKTNKQYYVRAYRKVGDVYKYSAYTSASKGD